MPATSAETTEQGSPRDPRWYRQVLGQYPTGVCVVTAAGSEGPPAGLAVGSFTSASLDPPLIAFLPDKSSTSWPRVRDVGRFCVNILAADQEAVCRQFATKAEDKFGGIEHRPAPFSGAPIVAGVVAWIDCALEGVSEVGDHYVVVGRVEEMAIESSAHPLLFFQGGYGRFTHQSLAAPNSYGRLTRQLRHTDLARPELEALAAELGCRTAAAAAVDDEVVVLATAGEDDGGGETLVGQRLPFVPPIGAAWAAWAPDAVAAAWVSHRRLPEQREDLRLRLEAVRERGFSVGLHSGAQRRFAEALDLLAGGAVEPADLTRLIGELRFDPMRMSEREWRDARVFVAPVLGPDGEVVLMMSAHGFAAAAAANGAEAVAAALVERAARVSGRIAGGPASGA
jgi:flavin reductase (DIM6/NTAB) family NADH-FMN oxidoreductase RutF/DNA-binding IclR family transcriptional regulator